MTAGDIRNTLWFSKCMKQYYIQIINLDLCTTTQIRDILVFFKYKYNTAYELFWQRYNFEILGQKMEAIIKI